MSSPYLGLDLGLKRTGVAISESGKLVRPLTVIKWDPRKPNQLIEPLLQIINEQQIATLVIGLPINEDETATSQALKTTAIIQKIQAIVPQTTQIQVISEFHSTKDGRLEFPEAEKDAAAAAVILQSYLEQQGIAW